MVTRVLPEVGMWAWPVCARAATAVIHLSGDISPPTPPTHTGQDGWLVRAPASSVYMIGSRALWWWQCDNIVGLMKIGNIVPRAGLKPSSLAFWASVLPFHHIGSLKSPLYPRMQLLASEFSADYYTLPCGIVSLLLLTISYIQAMTLHTQSRFNNHTAHKLVQDQMFKAREQT